MMNLQARYQLSLQQPGFSPDAAQAAVVDYLQELSEALTSHTARAWFSRWWQNQHTPKGLYLWGTVGSGKTYLMDLFYHHLPFTEKWRIHYHAFMQQVQQQLNELTGSKNPIITIAKQLAARARVLCLDEFFVQDVADAMVLASLFNALAKEGTVLVITSNTAPDDLYKNGVQRQRFLPTIAFIKEALRVMPLQSACDYRLRALKQAAVFYTSIDEHSDTALVNRFKALTAAHTHIHEGILIVKERELHTLGYSSNVLWCEFAVLCVEPRSNYDYIELARTFQTVLLRAVPIMTDQQNDWVKRFIHLIDTLYDHHVKLVLSAAVPLEKIYQGSSLQNEMVRTQSRLREMQSHDYLASEHIG